ncbi:MAG: DUF2924 domain-containing protein [Armatimonadetes bacterium]|nr:DUF2924 domain-containing protein [Armatimonadota bacterium]
MSNSVLKQVANLKNLTYAELKNLYTTLHGSEPPAYNKDFIIKRLAYRLQEIAYGGLSEQARRKMDAALKRHGYDENGMPIGASSRRTRRTKDMPISGSRFVREWNGKRYEVTALHDGFEFNGRKYRSLSAIAKAITGTHWNGRAFFGAARRSMK